MPTTKQRENLAVAYGAAATHVALFSTAATTTTPGTAISGLARAALTWTPGTVDGQIALTVTITGLANGTAIRGAGFYDALTGGNYLDGFALPELILPASGGPFTYTLSGTVSAS